MDKKKKRQQISAALGGGDQSDMIFGLQLAGWPVGFGDYCLVDGDGDSPGWFREKLRQQLADRDRTVKFSGLTVDDNFHSDYVLRENFRNGPPRKEWERYA